LKANWNHNSLEHNFIYLYNNFTRRAGNQKNIHALYQTISREALPSRPIPCDIHFFDIYIWIERNNIELCGQEY